MHNFPIAGKDAALLEARKTKIMARRPT
ncbi:hypothetical protein SKA58_07578 [Sphingomonas sp. SKA58]|nr:hypothetical protein SKA58_07578 [Sphingomonas sp. SKA58]